ncbi:hypothetical protein [Foetidibacter luteolus]|uniref:hypothetical protein n=1 Tax=Foetidibacter luteolus TaxID=2608880 RepID=UPI00129B9CAD|nr:hypothetical protein [Foetidibacter luteolus]
MIYAETVNYSRIISFYHQFSSFQKITDSLQIEIRVKKEYLATHDKKYYEVIYRYENFDITKDTVAEKRFDIDLTIKNTATNSIFIWLMSCSWEDNFLVNNNYIFIAGHDCDKNIPTIVEIKPGESRRYNITLIKSIKFDYPCRNCIYGRQVEETKLGLILISDITKRDYIDYLLNMEDRSKWIIVWSNSISLLGKQPEPKTINIYKN